VGLSSAQWERLMGDIRLRSLDERVADVLRTRARNRGISLAEEIRRMLAASIASDMEASARRAAALRAQTAGQEHHPAAESVVTIRTQRDAWG
jgi:plasmid stability protein